MRYVIRPANEDVMRTNEAVITPMQASVLSSALARYHTDKAGNHPDEACPYTDEVIMALFQVPTFLSIRLAATRWCSTINAPP